MTEVYYAEDTKLFCDDLTLDKERMAVFCRRQEVTIKRLREKLHNPVCLEGESDVEILRCENVSKVYGSGDNRVVALDHIDLSVEKGEFVAIVGASGSGKSTLLHILGSVDKPTEGKVLVEGTDISTMNQTQAAIFRRRKVGLVYQFYNLIPTLTVRKNILIPLMLDKRKVNQEYFDQIVRSLGIGDRLEALPGQLSGGQQQRAAIARSLIYRPALLLADEPTGNLDRKNGEEIIDLLKLSNRNLNQTVLLVTHDEKIALEADRVITIEDGKIISDRKRG
jgi:putative ABC transport system ATP-binding protein